MSLGWIRSTSCLSNFKTSVFRSRHSASVNSALRLRSHKRSSFLFILGENEVAGVKGVEVLQEHGDKFGMIKGNAQVIIHPLLRSPIGEKLIPELLQLP